MIHKHFLLEANRIRSDYLQTIENFNNKEEYIKEKKEYIEDIMKKLDIAVKNSDHDIRDEVKDELFLIETTINKIQKDVIILDKKLKKLQKETELLFSKIQKHHPDLTTEEIQKEVFYALVK